MMWLVLPDIELSVCYAAKVLQKIATIATAAYKELINDQALNSKTIQCDQASTHRSTW